MAEGGKIEVDNDYLKSLEQKLKKLKEVNLDRKEERRRLFNDFSILRDQQLSELIARVDQKFEDDFVVNVPLQANWVRKKLAPETVAINKQELVKLVKSDQLEKTALKEKQD